MLDYCQLPVSLFLILSTTSFPIVIVLIGSVVQYNFSENDIDISKEIDT